MLWSILSNKYLNTGCRDLVLFWTNEFDENSITPTLELPNESRLTNFLNLSIYNVLICKNKPKKVGN